MLAYMSRCYTPPKGLTYTTRLTINMEYFLLNSFHEIMLAIYGLFLIDKDFILSKLYFVPSL